MTIKYYLDTSIWLDFYEKRGANGEKALKLILKIIEEDHIILYSDLHILEFKNFGFNAETIVKIFSIAKPRNILRVHIYREQQDEARKIAFARKIPKKDVLHAILARDNDAQLVATDVHFQKISDIAKAKRPEELI